MTMLRKLSITLALLAIPVVLLAAPTIDWFTVDGGGATSAGGSLQVSGTIGQPDATSASAMTGGTLTLTGGFWGVTLPSCTSFAPADFNQDCFVDVQDLAIFKACVTGPLVPYDPQNLPAGCILTPDGTGHIAADFNHDGDVDQSDFAIFQRCYSGAGVPADPNCAN